MACKQRLFFLFLFILAGRLAFGASEMQEKSLWTLWSLQINNPAQHEAIVAACQQMQKASPTNPLLPVGQGLAAWHSLRLGKTNEAFAVFSEMVAAAATPTATATAGAEMGRRWLTRLDREKVRGALALYYRNAIEYPINLQPLKKKMPGEKDVPLADRWGVPWQYQLATFKIIQGTRGQRYLLQSKTLLESSDLAKALERPYAGRILLQPVSLTITGGGVQNVVFQTPGDRPEKILLSEGGQAAGVTLTYIGARILILCDGDHWRVVLKPNK
ncbi:MAG: hypothetical protein KKD33_00500 [Verrucomicrobia bacterium]|nr:hypothetical protein [Verrucomicrobiota bacterium]MBU4285336.1 hypothetical protein [Verrucomicrobiota bacterium]